jgi:4-amino-4-deoxy-L-arabinose transferase-like glycosyltransferase
MTSTIARRWLLSALAAILLLSGVSSRSFADDTDNAALKEQMRALMERIDALTKRNRRHPPRRPQRRRSWL